MSTFDPQILRGHTAVLGMTGSGKTSTAKLLVEQVSKDARVCILDPVKSDWWGITSSRDGKRAGLPFDILGGPHGHVPLHAGAGQAIGELVAKGGVRHSIIDMADFEPGGVSRFFNDFAAAVWKHTRGLLYLVWEEAHEFAPKERSGIGAENMSIYYAKKFATGARTKGVRLVVCTQRVQSLHNAVLGSCQTVIAHRFIAPADQEPVMGWLKGALKDKAAIAEIASTLSDLKDGEAYQVHGKDVQRRQFPRIHTFDNSATPTSDDDVHIVQAKVDTTQLRALIGTAVAEAEANDPAVLKRRIAELERFTLNAQKSIPADAVALDRAREQGYAKGRNEGWAAARDEMVTHCAKVLDVVSALAESASAAKAEVRRIVGSWTGKEKPPAETTLRDVARAAHFNGLSVKVELKPKPSIASGPSEVGTGGKRRILTALAQYPEGMDQRKLSILVDIAPKGGTWRTYMAELRGKGWVDGGKGHMRITDAGLHALGNYEPLPTGEALVEYWRQRLGASGKRAIFEAVVDAYPNEISTDAVSRATGIAREGGTWRTYMAELRGLGIIEGRGDLKASADLFA